MAPKFGTSGLRGLVTELTPALVSDYTAAFLAACDTGDVICLGRDLRPSSAGIAQTIADAAAAAGCAVIDCGELPTPALAFAANMRGAGAVMVTGSHIPADRNGIKFYSRSGEISKTDEGAISAALGATQPGASPGALQSDDAAAAGFRQRYVSACGPAALSGMRIGHYTHSSVGRDLLSDILRDLGAEVVELGRSESFVPVDTEAVAADVRDQIRNWVAEYKLDALVSTDGDADRPLLADEKGAVVPGDVLGQIVAQELGAEAVVTPVSSNSGVSKKTFRTVLRTKIGSPYVVAGMQETGGKVVGYEANGGFLLGFEARSAAGTLAPLMTRDCVLPLVIGLMATRASSVSDRISAEPPVVTLADRLQDVPQDFSRDLIEELASNGEARAAFLSSLGVAEVSLDLTDGVRMILADNQVVHLRPSGNAPELRIYTEAATPAAAQNLLDCGLGVLRERLSAWRRGPAG